jgi:hypothetical protein
MTAGIRPRSYTNDAIEDHRRVEKLFALITHGSREDILEIQDLLANDPKRYIVSNMNELLVNKLDKLG